MNVSLLSRSTFTDEKRRFETRINQLEEELEDAQTTLDGMNDKLKKYAMNLEQTNFELTAEKSKNEKFEVCLTRKIR